MIIKGGTRSGGRMLAEHLERADTNETVQVLDVRGTAADDLDGAFREMVAVASGTRCKKPLYHASINTDEAMTPEQWRHSVETLEKALGLDDQPRAVVRHVKGGREHVHVVWSRIDAENMKAISDSNNYHRHEEVSRHLEKEFGHRQIEGVHTGDKTKPRPVAEINPAEQQQAERTGLTVEQITADIQGAWQRSHDGGSFARELGAAGYVLARGDRRDMVILDDAGGIHSPRRRLGLKAWEIKKHCADLDPQALPSVAEGRRLFKFREATEATFNPATDQTELVPVDPAENLKEPEAETPPADKQPETQAPPPAEQRDEKTERAAETGTAPAGGGPARDTDRRDGEPTIRGGDDKKPPAKQQAEPVESGGLLSLIFAKVTGLFDFMRHTLFAAAFAPTVDAERDQEQVPDQQAQQEAGQPIVQQPDRPRPNYRPFDPEKVVLRIVKEKDHDARERDSDDSRARERTREMIPPPDPSGSGGGDDNSS